MRKLILCVLSCCALLATMLCLAEDNPAGPSESPPAEAPSMTVAVLGFEAADDVPKDLGKKIDVLVFAGLSSKPELRLVEREKLDAALGEMELTLAGMASADDAVKVGHLVSAKVLVTGRVFSINGDVVIVARIIGTETGRVYGEVVKTSAEKSDGAAKELSDLIAASIARNADSLAAETLAEKDRIAEIKRALAERRLPRVLVVVAEQHLGGPTVDPAAETEISYYLLRCGFAVVDKGSKNYAAWASAFLKDPSTGLPSGVGANVDVIVLGEAISQFGLRRGNLFAAKARLEVRAVDRRTGEILAIDRETNAAVDVAERIAAKTAVQECAADVAARIIPEFVDKWNRARE